MLESHLAFCAAAPVSAGTPVRTGTPTGMAPVMALADAEGRHDEWRPDGFRAWREEMNKRLASGEIVEA